MWITGEWLRAATEIHPQANVGKEEVLNRLCGGNFSENLSTEYLSTVHTTCGENFRRKIPVKIGTASKIFTLFLSCPAKKVTKEGAQQGAGSLCVTDRFVIVTPGLGSMPFQGWVGVILSGT